MENFPDDDDIGSGHTIRALDGGSRVFARYRLVREIGRGGMGVVWLARDERLERDVALKFLPDLLRGDPVALDDLREETNRSLELTHPNIVRIHDLAEEKGAAAIVMEYVEGQTLSDRRLAQPERVFGVDGIREWVGQLCTALEYAHGEKKVVHRDLKPANLMVDGEGRLRVMDFGIAGTLTDSMSRLSAKPMPASGTLVYMSPQQAMGFPPTLADDVYSLGVTIYELLTGKPPFFRGNIQHQIETLEPPSMAERRTQLGIEGGETIPEPWEETVAACLAKTPGERPESVKAVWERLGGVVSSSPKVIAAAQERGEGARRKESLQEDDGGEAKRMRVRSKAVALAAAVGVLTLAVLGWISAESKRNAAAANVVSEGRQILGAGDRVRARELAESALRDAPRSREARALLEEIEAEIRSLVQKHAEAASVAAAERDFLTAVAEYESLLKWDPAHPEAKEAVATYRAMAVPLEIDVDPADATIEFPGLGITVKGGEGVAPVPIGVYALQISREGFQTWKKDLAVRNDDPVQVECALERSRGGLSVESVPSGLSASVQLIQSPVSSDSRNQTTTRSTPIALADLPTGIYEVRINRTDFPTYVSNIEVEAGKTAVARHEFKESDRIVRTPPPPIGKQTLKVPEDHRTISGALAAARPGDRIEVGAGIYHESVSISKQGIELIGAGRNSTIIRSGATSNVISITADDVKMIGLTVEQTGTDTDDSRYDVVQVRYGQEVVILDCRIRDGAGMGVRANNRSEVIISNCEISGCGWDGIAVSGSGTKIVAKDNRITSCLSDGISFWESGAGEIRNNVIERCESGLVVLSDSKVTISGNKVADCGGGGISVHDSNSVTIENNSVERSGNWGILVKNCSASIIGNTVSKNGSKSGSARGYFGGIAVRGASAKPRIIGNRCFSNTGRGISVESSCYPAAFEGNSASGNTISQIDRNASFLN